MGRRRAALALLGCCLTARAAADEPAAEARAQAVASLLQLEPESDRQRAIVTLSRAGLDVDALEARLQHE